MEKSEPVIKLMAQRAAADLNFQALMRIVAAGKATINEHKEFQAHVDWIKEILRRLERGALEAKEARANVRQQMTIDTIAPSASSSTFSSGSAVSPNFLPQGQLSSKGSELIDHNQFFTPTIFHYNWATLEHFPGNMSPSQYPASSPPPQPSKFMDDKVADDNLNNNRSLLRNQDRDEVNAMSFAPNHTGTSTLPTQATRRPSGNRNASSRDLSKGVATSKASRVQPGQNQLTRLDFHALSSSSALPPSVTPVAKARGPGYYSTEAPRTRVPESPQTQSSPQTPKKRVHFSESPEKNESDNYYSPNQPDGPPSSATASRGNSKQASTPARHTTASPGSREREAKQPKLVVNMDEGQIYIAYSRAFKELEAKMANNPPKKAKDELQEKWTRMRKDIKLTREQNHRFKKLYKQIQEEDKQRSENRKKAQEEAESQQRSTAYLGRDASNVGKRNTKATLKTGRPKATGVKDYEMTENVDSDNEETN